MCAVLRKEYMAQTEHICNASTTPPGTLQYTAFPFGEDAVELKSQQQQQQKNQIFLFWWLKRCLVGAGG